MRILLVLLGTAIVMPTFLTSCQTPKTYAPAAQSAVVESVEVETKEFQGRPEAYAIVRGVYSSPSAQLVDSKQSRDGNVLFLDVREQTPRDSVLTTTNGGTPTFETKIPIELLGLEPGDYLLSVNGVQAPLTVPALQAQVYSGRELRASRNLPPVRVVDEFIAIEDSSFVSPAPDPTDSSM